MARTCAKLWFSKKLMGRLGVLTNEINVLSATVSYLKDFAEVYYPALYFEMNHKVQCEINPEAWHNLSRAHS